MLGGCLSQAGHGAPWVMVIQKRSPFRVKPHDWRWLWQHKAHWLTGTKGDVAQLPDKAGREQAGGYSRAVIIMLALTPVRTLNEAWGIW